MQVMHVHKGTSLGTGDDTCRLSCQCRQGLPQAPVSRSMSPGHPKATTTYGHTRRGGAARATVTWGQLSPVVLRQRGPAPTQTRIQEGKPSILTGCAAKTSNTMQGHPWPSPGAYKEHHGPLVCCRGHMASPDRRQRSPSPLPIPNEESTHPHIHSTSLGGSAHPLGMK